MNITGEFMISRYDGGFNLLWNRTGAFYFENITLENSYSTVPIGSGSDIVTKNFFDASRNWTGNKKRK